MLGLAALSLVNHPFERWGAVAWSTALVVHFLVLRHGTEDTSASVANLLHAFGVWVTGALAVQEAGWAAVQLTGRSGAWEIAAWGAALAAIVVVIARCGLFAMAWPWTVAARSYLTWGAAPLVALATLWSAASNFGSSGGAHPLPYLPILNPLDVSQMFVLVGMLAWLGTLHRKSFLATESVIHGAYVVSALGFLWLNAVLLRTLHHYFEVPLRWSAMMDSTLVQSSLSIFWSVIALPVMVYATRGASRILWMTGATLLSLTVGKLFFIDLAHTGTLARIVSFLAVGGLLLLIGYLAPMPRRSDKTESERTPP
jgi:uncharacterized membrane protein